MCAVPRAGGLSHRARWTVSASGGAAKIIFRATPLICMNLLGLKSPSVLTLTFTREHLLWSNNAILCTDQLLTASLACTPTSHCRHCLEVNTAGNIQLLSCLRRRCGVTVCVGKELECLARQGLNVVRLCFKYNVKSLDDNQRIPGSGNSVCGCLFVRRVNSPEAAPRSCCDLL